MPTSPRGADIGIHFILRWENKPLLPQTLLDNIFDRSTFKTSLPLSCYFAIIHPSTFHSFLIKTDFESSLNQTNYFFSHLRRLLDHWYDAASKINREFRDSMYFSYRSGLPELIFRR